MTEKTVTTTDETAEVTTDVTITTIYATGDVTANEVTTGKPSLPQSDS